MSIESYRDLVVWQKSMDLAELAYRHTALMPRSELFGQVSQIRRAASSVPANIAEGYGRESQRSYIYFLKTARGSLKEFETHVLLARRVDNLSSDKSEELLTKAETIGRMLNGLIKAVEARLTRRRYPSDSQLPTA